VPATCPSWTVLQACQNSDRGEARGADPAPQHLPSMRRPAARRRIARAQARGQAHSCRHRSSFKRARAQAPGRERAGQHTAAATRPFSKRKGHVRKCPGASARAKWEGARARRCRRCCWCAATPPTRPTSSACARTRACCCGARTRASRRAQPRHAAGAGWCPGLWAAAPPDAFTGLCAKVHMLKGALLLIAAPGLRVYNHLSLSPLKSSKSPSGTDWAFADGGACFDRQPRDAATAEL